MNSKQTISKISELSATLREIKSHLVDDKELNGSDILTITDVLDEIEDTTQKINDKSQNIFMKAGAKSISDNVKDLFGRIEEIENNKLVQDEEILKKLYEISFKEDYLELNFFYLNPCDIETILIELDNEMDSVLLKKPFNEKVISPIIDRIKSKLVDLHFRYDFPIVEELDENKNSYAHRLVLAADEIKEKNPKKAKYLIEKIDDLMDLVWISKMFMYGDVDKAQSLLDRLNNGLKGKVKEIIRKVKKENAHQIKEKWMIPAALMNYVEKKINA